MKNKTFIQLLTVFWICVILPLTPAAAEKAEVTFELKQVSGDVYCLYGSGGNIGVLKTDEGLLLVDAQFAEIAPGILKTIATISDKPVKYLVNTHYHNDHTNGTPVLGKGAVIIMHPDCKASLKNPPDTKEWTEGAAIKLGGETVKLLHFGDAHTSGDLVVVFEKAKVLHMGDLFFNGSAPYIDVKDGSDTENWVRVIKTICKQYPGYKIIPGHGKVTDAAGYMKFAGYLTFLRKKVAAAIKEGKTREQTKKAATFEGYEHLTEYGSFITKKNNVGWIYDEMTRAKK
jgi:glyoxylase-like metal-dependent hydrolase (beta-lactamase superfamily II)